MIIAVQCRGPRRTGGIGGLQRCAAGHVGAGAVLRLEVAHRAADGHFLGRALGSGVGGEQFGRIGDQVLGLAQRILEGIEAVEIRHGAGQRAEVARQAYIRCQANTRRAQLRATAHQRLRVVLQVGDGDRAGKRKRRAISTLALGQHIADGVVADLRIDHLAVDHDVAGTDDLCIGTNRCLGRVLAINEADRATQSERCRLRRRGRRGSAASATTGVAAELAQRRTDACAGERLRHVHQPIATTADGLDLLLTRQRRHLRLGDQGFGLVERGDARRLHRDIAAVATSGMGGHVAVQARFGSNVLQADRTGQTDRALVVRTRGGGGFNRRGIHRRDVDAACGYRRAAGLDHGPGVDVDVADGGGECRRRVVDRERFGGKLHRRVRIGLHRDVAACVDSGAAADDRFGGGVDLRIGRTQAEQVLLRHRIATGILDRIAVGIGDVVALLVSRAGSGVVDVLARTGMQRDVVACSQRRGVLYFHACGGGGMQERGLLTQHLVHTQVHQRITEILQRGQVGEAAGQVGLHLVERCCVLVIAGIDHRRRGQFDVIGGQLRRAPYADRGFGAALTQPGIGDGRCTQLDLAAIADQRQRRTRTAGIDRGFIHPLQAGIGIAPPCRRHCHEDGAGDIDRSRLHPYALVGVDGAVDIDHTRAAELFRLQGAVHQAIQAFARLQNVIHHRARRCRHRQRTHVQHAALAHQQAVRINEEHAATHGLSIIKKAVQGAVDVGPRVGHQIDQVVHLGAVLGGQDQIHRLPRLDTEFLERVEGNLVARLASLDRRGGDFPAILRGQCHRGRGVSVSRDGTARITGPYRQGQRDTQYRTDRSGQAGRTWMLLPAHRSLGGQAVLASGVDTIHDRLRAASQAGLQRSGMRTRGCTRSRVDAV
ncbi:hypothetical protein D3C71_739040 [compost metagenome]